MELAKNIKKLIPNQIKILLRKTLNFLIPAEGIKDSKNKWNKLASENARYFVLTDLGEKITEEEFRAAGRKDYEELVANDALIHEWLADFTNKTVLEIGCGIGRITEFLAQNFAEVFAVDISEEMIKKGRERFKNADNINFIANNGKNYPIKNESIDFVFSYIVFQHMPNKKVVEENFKEIKRVLKENGIAKIQVRGLPTSKLNWFYGPSFTRKELEKMVNKFGLKIQKTAGENQRYFWMWCVKK